VTIKLSSYRKKNLAFGERRYSRSLIRLLRFLFACSISTDSFGKKVDDEKAIKGQLFHFVCGTEHAGSFKSSCMSCLESLSFTWPARAILAVAELNVILLRSVTAQWCDPARQSISRTIPYCTGI